MNHPTDPAVREALAALAAFRVGPDTSERVLRSLLSTWTRFRHLNPDQVNEVIDTVKGYDVPPDVQPGGVR